MDSRIYNSDFHVNRLNDTYYAAEQVADIVLDRLDINSVCDVGGGIGVWCAAFKKKTVQDKGKSCEVTCMDGEYVLKEGLELCVERQEFMVTDLERSIPCEKRYDLAISLEVAEHLRPERAEGFVHDLTCLSDLILFSAAVPGQGGGGHLNEMFLSDWSRIFLKYNYVCCDIIRPKIWNDDKIDWWYRQNMVIFIKKESKYESCFADYERGEGKSLIHPQLYLNKLYRIEGIMNSRWYKVIKPLLFLKSKL